MTDVVEDVRRLTGIPADYMRRAPGRAVDIPYNVLNIRLIGWKMGWVPHISWKQGLPNTIAWRRGRATG